MLKKNAFKQKLSSRINNAIKPVRQIYNGEKTLSGLWRKTINTAKILIVAARKFMTDDCPTKASSITYTIILSLVPALTVGLSIYSLYYGVGQDKKELFDKILQFMVEHNIKVNIDPIFDAILGLVENAGKIGGISAAVMIFSATAMLRTMEKSMNDIWKVKKGRPILLKIIYYWAALTLGPIMLAAGMTVATQLSVVLSSPNYNAQHMTGDKTLWVVGNKATVLSADIENSKFTDRGIKSGGIDFENQRVFSYDAQARTFAEQEGRIEPIEMKKTRFTGIQFLGNKGWIIGSDGILLITGDGGRSWNLSKFASFNFNAIRMLTDMKGFIAAESGAVLATVDGGETWSVEEYEGRPNFNAVAFFKDRGIIPGSRGTILQTSDGGSTWEIRQLGAAKRLNRLVNINNAFFVNDKQVWLMASDGILLYSGDSGSTWTIKKFKEYDYRSAYFFNPDEGLVGADDSTIIRTKNGGESWESVDVDTLQVNSLVYKNGRLLAVGDAGTIIVSKDRGAKWETIKKGKKFGYTIINFIAPFAIIWLLFLLAYITLPNTYVPFKPAALGASFTGAVWVIFILLFIVYVKGFAQSTFAVYGALAAIPLFLLMVYASSVIILYGAEVAHTLMHPESYRSLRRSFKGDELNVYQGIALLGHVYRKFEDGHGASTIAEMRKVIAAGSDEIERYTNFFLAGGFIIQENNKGFLPAKGSENIRLNDVLDSLTRTGRAGAVSGGEAALRKGIGKLFNRIETGRKKTVGNLTLKDLIS